MGRPRKSLLPIEAEAKDFLDKKEAIKPAVVLTPRKAVAAMIFAGLLARSTGIVNPAEMKKEAEYLADLFLSNT